VDEPLRFLHTADAAAVLAMALGLSAVWSALFPRLRTDAAPKGIASLELCWTANRARRVVNSWERKGMMAAARRSVLLDEPFILFYSVTLATLGVLAARAAGASSLLSHDHAQTVASVMTLAACVAALLDLAENLGLCLLLRGHFATGLSAATSVVSSAKWLLVATAIVSELGLLAFAGAHAAV
jgi:hypothetical protein